MSNTVNDVYAIMKDINLIDIFPANNANEWVGFTGFKGKMVSAGKTISLKKGDTLGTLNCASGNCGLFNSISEGRIHNIKFEMNVSSKSGNVGVLAGAVSASNLSQISVKGNVTGAGVNAGGLIGQIAHSRTNSSSQTLTGEDGRTLNQVFDRAYAKGKVTGKNNVGGAFGYIYTPVNNVKVVSAAKSEKCPSDASVTVSIPEVTSPMNVLNDIKITNVYALSDVEGADSVGGLIGNISCDNVTLTGKIAAYSIDESCKLVNNGSQEYSVIRAGRISIGNAYAGGSVTGIGSKVGGFIGTYAYTNNTLGTKTEFGDVSHNLNNIYATGQVTSDGGALVGYRSLNTTYKNAYYWPSTGNGSAAATSCAQCMSAASIPNISGVSAFEFKSAVAQVKDTDIKLLDQLNSNIAASSAALLNSKVSSSWVEIEHTMNNATYKIPSLDIKPVNLEIEE